MATVWTFVDLFFIRHPHVLQFHTLPVSTSLNMDWGLDLGSIRYMCLRWCSMLTVSIHFLQIWELSDPQGTGFLDKHVTIYGITFNYKFSTSKLFSSSLSNLLILFRDVLISKLLIINFTEIFLGTEIDCLSTEW